MEIDAIIFDMNGTLINIHTDETQIDLYRKMRNFMRYFGIEVEKEELRDLYSSILKEYKKKSSEKFPEFDAEKVWEEIIRQKRTSFSDSLPSYALKALPHTLATLFRSASFAQKIELYEGTKEVLKKLRTQYRLAAVTDGQKAYARAEMNILGLIPYFDPIIVSGEVGFRKPDPRMFSMALEKIGTTPEKTIYVGNDMYRDVYGAKSLGMKSVFFSSNQGDKEPAGKEPDYIIYNISQLLDAISFLAARP